MPGLVAQDHGLQGLLLGIQDHPGLQGVTLVLPVGREGLLQEDALWEGHSPGVPGVEGGDRPKPLKRLAGSEDTCAPGACHCLAELRLFTGD